MEIINNKREEVSILKQLFTYIQDPGLNFSSCLASKSSLMAFNEVGSLVAEGRV